FQSTSSKSQEFIVTHCQPKVITARFGKTFVFVLLLFYTSLLLLVYSTPTNNWSRFLYNTAPIRQLPTQTNIVYIKTHKCASET
ncbi:hypothetical protein GH825_30570, partial [Bacillus thuringiensis]|nr:hypothetical protein [Bacillus thuringiensis]